MPHPLAMTDSYTTTVAIDTDIEEQLGKMDNHDAGRAKTREWWFGCEGASVKSVHFQITNATNQC